MSLTLVPVLVAAVRVVADPTYLPRMLTSVLGLLVLVTATGLSVAGALWLNGLEAASLPAWPWHRRDHAREWKTEMQLARVLGVAAGLAGPGRSLHDAVADAVARERTLIATTFREHLESGGTPELTAHAADTATAAHPELLTACVRALQADLDHGVAPHAALTSTAAHLRRVLEQRVTQRQDRLPVSALVPFAACLLPATVLLAIVGW